eukprot:2613446-Heterocapsa_arctica.AAC.1
MDCGKHYAQRRDLVTNNACTGKPDRKGQLALETIGKTCQCHGHASEVMRNSQRVWVWSQLGSACPGSTGTISRWALGSPDSG